MAIVAGSMAVGEMRADRIGVATNTRHSAEFVLRILTSAPFLADFATALRDTALGCGWLLGIFQALF